MRVRSYIAGLMGELARRRNNERLGRPESRHPKLLSWGIGMCVGEVQNRRCGPRHKMTFPKVSRFQFWVSDYGARPEVELDRFENNYGEHASLSSTTLSLKEDFHIQRHIKFQARARQAMQERHATSPPSVVQMPRASAACLSTLRRKSAFLAEHTRVRYFKTITCVMRSDPILPIGIARACV